MADWYGGGGRGEAGEEQEKSRARKAARLTLRGEDCVCCLKCDGCDVAAASRSELNEGRGGGTGWPEGAGGFTGGLGFP